MQRGWTLPVLYQQLQSARLLTVRGREYNAPFAMPKATKLTDIQLEALALPREAATAFRRGVRCVVAHYERHLSPSVETAGIRKLLIGCVDAADEAATPGDVLAVAEVNVSFPFAEYDRAPVRERKELALRVVHKGSLRIARHYGWPEAPFEAAHAGVIADDLHNQWQWGTKRHPKSGLVAEVRCEHEHDAFRAWLTIKDRGGAAVAEALAFQELPSEYQFVPLLGKLNWVSDAEVVLFSKEGGEVARLSTRA